MVQLIRCIQAFCGSGPGRGGACEAFTAHGFVGIESETVAAMRSWVKTGAVQADVAR